MTTPKEHHSIRPYISEALKELKFPGAKIPVLSPIRTFWEKVTLIHAECNRAELKKNANRLSRHWYDLAMILGHNIGRNAILDQKIMIDVIEHKKIFFNASYAKYDDCLNGNFHLIPNSVLLKELESDYQQMILAGMFYQEPPSFNQLIEKIREMEEAINLGIPVY